MWGNTVAIHNVFKEKKSTKTILKKKEEEEDNFGRKKQKKNKKMEKNMRGKLKLNSQPAQY